MKGDDALQRTFKEFTIQCRVGNDGSPFGLVRRVYAIAEDAGELFLSKKKEIRVVFQCERPVVERGNTGSRGRGRGNTGNTRARNRNRSSPRGRNRNTGSNHPTTKKVKMKLSWQYRHLLKIGCFWLRPHHLYLLMHFVERPTLTEHHGGRKWVEVDPFPQDLDLLATYATVGFMFNLPNFEAEEHELVKTVAKFTRIANMQRASEPDHFSRLSIPFSAEEARYLVQSLRNVTQPLLGPHLRLCRDIDLLMYEQKEGGKRQCLSCNEEFYWFESHAICMPPRECIEVPNVTEHVYRRCVVGDLMEAQLKVDTIPDPAGVDDAKDPECKANRDDKKGDCKAIEIMRTNHTLWAGFLLTTYCKFVVWISNHKESEFLNCRNDRDWEKLSIPVADWLRLLNCAMQTTLCQVVPLEMDVDDEEKRLEFVHNLLTIAGNIFIMPSRFDKPEDLRAASDPERRAFFEDPTFCVRLKTHYVRSEISNIEDRIADVCAEWSATITGDNFNTLWTFWGAIMRED